METVTVTQAKNGLSALLDRVRSGASVLITDRGIPVARIEPVALGEDPDGHLARLVRAGIVRPPPRPSPAVLDEPPPEPLEAVDLVAALLEERRSGW